MALEVDHFNPTKKNDPVRDYLNLFPATRHCNNRKRTFWPKTKSEARAGKRLLNPRREFDYDTQIVEYIKTGELIGLTPAAKFHILKLDLNAPFLCKERRDRTAQARLVAAGPIRLIERQDNLNEIAVLIANVRKATNHLISPIQAATPEQIAQASKDGFLL